MSAPSPERPPWWRRVPEPLWWSLVPVLGGFVVAWPDLVGPSVSRWTRCASVDWADLGLGAVGVLLVVAGLVAQVRRAPDRRCQPQLFVGLVIFLGGLSVYHLLTGLGRLGGVCS